MKRNYNNKIPLIILLPSLMLGPYCYAVEVPDAARPGRIESTPILPPKRDLEYTIEEQPKEEEKDEIKEEQKKEKEQIKFNLQQIIIEGANEISQDELLKVYGKKLGQDLTLPQLRDIAQDIETYYRSKGYFLARIIIPPQRLKKQGAVVKLVILEGRISKINLIGEAGKNTKMLLSYLRPVEEAKVIDNDTLEHALLLANDIPGITVQAVLSPSPTVVGAAELNVKISKNRPSGFLTLDNRGSKFIGNKQLRVGGSFYNLASADSLYADFMTALPDNDQLQSFTAIYKLLVGSKGASISVTAKKTHTNPLIDNNGALEPLVTGRSDKAEVSYSHPLIKSRFKNLNVAAGGYFLDSKNKLKSDDSFLYMDKLRVIYASADYASSSAKSSLSANVKLSKGLSIANATVKDSNFKSRGTDSSGVFAKLNATVQYIRNFGQRFSVLLAGTGQHTNQSLLSSEEFGFGGEAFGSAYNSSEIIGDKGVAGKIELRFNTFPKIPDVNYIQFFTAYHRGKIWNNGGPSDTQEDYASAASISFGARFAILDNITGSAEVAKPLVRDSSSNNTRKLRYFLKMTATF